MIKLRAFEYGKRVEKLLTPEIVSQLTQIHEHRGKQTLFIETKADVLKNLSENAKIQSTAASNRIEGIFTSDTRLKLIAKDKALPRNRDEQEIAGYRDVLKLIHENHDYIPPKPSQILQLHRDLYRYSGLTFGGKYKISNNVIAEEDAQGNKFIRFQPVDAWETPVAMDAICKSYDEVIGEGKVDPLLIIPMLVLDFLCIHPFSDGNGRMARLLTLLLLYRENYIVGKYVSIEKLIEETKETYYETLYQSSIGWHENANDYGPFVRYLLGIILSAFREFSSRVEYLSIKGLSKPDKITEIIKGTLGKITKSEIAEKCPDISAITIQRTLADLLGKGDIIKISGGRYASYTWNRDK